MLVHEMQIVKQLSDFCTKESDVAGEVRLETIRAQLMSEGLPCASSNSFLPLLQFVVEQGGNRQHGFVQPLVEFHQLFVNPRVRRLRETQFPCGLLSPVAAIAAGLAESSLWLRWKRFARWMDRLFRISARDQDHDQACEGFCSR